MTNFKYRLALALVCCGFLVSCDDDNSVVSSKDRPLDTQVTQKTVEVVKSEEELRILKKLADDQKALAAQERRIEEKLIADAKKRQADSEKLAKQVEENVQRTQEEYDLKISESEVIIDPKNSLTGSVD